MKELSAGEITELVFEKAPPDIEIWRQNNIPIKGRKFIGKKGIGDITGYHIFSGKRIEIEVKKVGDYLSQEQFDFLNSIYLAGAYSYIITQHPNKENEALEIHINNDSTLKSINEFLKNNTKKIRSK